MPAIATLSRFDGTGPARAACAAAIALIAALTPVRAAEFSMFAPFAGMPSGPVSAVKLDGSLVSIAAESNRLVVVHFFASWCEPCEAELPSLAAFARSRADTIRLIGVNVGEPASRAKKFAARFGLPGDVALDEDKAVAGAFRVRGLPATVAIAPGGKSALAAAGPLDWTSPKTADALTSLGR